MDSQDESLKFIASTLFSCKFIFLLSSVGEAYVYFCFHCNLFEEIPAHLPCDDIDIIYSLVNMNLGHYNDFLPFINTSNLHKRKVLGNVRE
jgi:hypothetical protein